MKATAVITAGGKGNRFGHNTPKQFLPIAGIPLIVHSLRAFERAETIDQIVVVLPKEELYRLDLNERKKWELRKVTTVVAGGDTRQDSVRLGLEAIDWTPTIVAIHDAARCLITPDVIDKAVKHLSDWDGTIVALPIRDTLKRVEGEKILRTESRENLWGMQTPQIFRFPFIREAYQKAKKEKFEATDDAAVAEWMGGRISVFQGSTRNLKVTYPEDLEIAEWILRK